LAGWKPSRKCSNITVNERTAHHPPSPVAPLTTRFEGLSFLFWMMDSIIGFHAHDGRCKAKPPWQQQHGDDVMHTPVNSESVQVQHILRLLERVRAQRKGRVRQEQQMPAQPRREVTVCREKRQ